MTNSTQLRIVRQHVRSLAREAIILHRTQRRVLIGKGEAVRTALHYGHRLGRWLDDPHRAAHQVATCLHCHAGADVDLGSGDLSVSDLLREPCARRIAS